MNYKRWIDVTKGIGILLVIAGHNNFGQFVSTMIFTYHMPLFFFINGHLFNYNKYKTNKIKFVVNKFNRLVVPYFITNIIILSIYILLSYFKLYSFGNNSPTESLIGVFYGNGAPLSPSTIFTNTLNVPSWFLLSLFCASLILYIIAYFHEKYGLSFSSLACFLLVLAGFEISKYILLPWGSDIACVSMIFTFSAYLINYYHLNWLDKDFKSNSYYFVFVLFLLAAILINGMVDMNTRKYGNRVIFVIGGFLGTRLTIELAKQISKKETIFTRIFIYLGQNSLIIMLFHLFTSALFINILEIFIHIKYLIYNSPILCALNMLISSMITIIIIKKLPFLNGIYYGKTSL